MSLRELFYLWCADLYRYEGRIGVRAFLKHWLLSPGFTFSVYFRLSGYLASKRQLPICWPLYVVARVLLRRASYRFGIFIPYDTQIDAGLYIGHCNDIHFNPHAVVGKNCNISQGVTLGQANRGRNQGYPQIGDGVYIGPGAKIVGAVRVGNNVAIGANCVVTRDVPDHAVVVGVPGRVISYDGAAAYVEHTAYAEHADPRRKEVR